MFILGADFLVREKDLTPILPRVLGLAPLSDWGVEPFEGGPGLSVPDLASPTCSGDPSAFSPL